MPDLLFTYIQINIYLNYSFNSNTDFREEPELEIYLNNK